MVELLLTQGMGLNVIPCVSSWGELALCAQSSCAALCSVGRFLIILARQTHVCLIPFDPHCGCVFTESVEKRVADS